MKEIDPHTIQFLQHNKEFIEENNYEGLYNAAEFASLMTGRNISEVTALLLAARIDPLDYMTRVPDFYLYQNTDVEEFTIPEGIKSIGSSAFAWCVNLREVTIPASVREIAPTAFDTCDTLKDIYYGGTKEQWIVVGNMLRSIAVAVRKTKIHCSNGDLILSGGTGQWVEVDN